VVVGILEKEHGAVDQKGLPVKELFKLRGRGRGLPAHPLVTSRTQSEEFFWNTPADIFIPAATSRTVDAQQLDALERVGVWCIAAGANNPFVEQSFDSFETALNADKRFSLIPDFIANCGMARAFAYCMQPGVDVRARAIAEDIAHCVTGAVKEAVGEERRTKGIFQNALNLVAQKLEQ
jgi:glutamate dehydrogenase/leucine dehydrogenase